MNLVWKAFSQFEKKKFNFFSKKGKKIDKKEAIDKRGSNDTLKQKKKAVSSPENFCPKNYKLVLLQGWLKKTAWLCSNQYIKFGLCMKPVLIVCKKKKILS